MNGKMRLLVLLLALTGLQSRGQKSTGLKTGSGRSASVTEFGLKGDGSNEYEKFKAMAEWMSSHPREIRTLSFQSGKTYFLSKQVVHPGNATEEDIEFRDLNNILIKGEGATILIDGNYTRGQPLRRMLRIYFAACRNMTIENLTINGQRNLIRNDPSLKNGKENGLGLNGHGFCLMACENVKLVHCTALNNLGDGFNITGNFKGQRIPSRDIQIINCKSLFSGRQGLTVGQVVNLTVDHSEFSYTGQGGPYTPFFSPASGCDIEPNWGADAGKTRVSESTRNVVIKNCRFIANRQSQFVCGGDPRKYSNILVDSCYLSDEDKEKKLRTSGNFCLGLKSGVIFQNSTIISKYSYISFAKFSKPEPLSTSEVIFRNNIVYFGGDAPWIISSTGMKSILIENNRFIGTGSSSPDGRGEPAIQLKENGNAVWRNNHVFIPKEKFAGTEDGATCKFAEFKNWTLENPDFETDITPGFKTIAKPKFEIVADSGSLRETSNSSNKKKKSSAIVIKTK